jgi:hypothetical protein
MARGEVVTNARFGVWTRVFDGLYSQRRDCPRTFFFCIYGETPPLHDWAVCRRACILIGRFFFVVLVCLLARSTLALHLAFPWRSIPPLRRNQ